MAILQLLQILFSIPVDWKVRSALFLHSGPRQSLGCNVLVTGFNSLSAIWPASLWEIRSLHALTVLPMAAAVSSHERLASRSLISLVSSSIVQGRPEAAPVAYGDRIPSLYASRRTESIPRFIRLAARQ